MFAIAIGLLFLNSCLQSMEYLEVLWFHYGVLFDAKKINNITTIMTSFPRKLKKSSIMLKTTGLDDH